MSFHRPHACCFLLGSLVLCISSLGCGVGADSYPTASGSVATTKHPLVAQYNLAVPQKDATAWVEFGTDTTYGRQTSASPATTGFGQPVSILVGGMRPSTTYHMRAHIDGPSGAETWVDQDQTFKTGPLPSSVPAPGLIVSHPNPALTPAAGVEMVDLVIAPNPTNFMQAIVTDLNGKIIWYYDVGKGNVPYPFKPLANGNFAVNIAENPLLPSATSVLREIDLAGNIVSEIPLALVNQGLQAKGYSFSVGGFHHDFLSLPNGHWILLAYVYQKFTDLPGYPGVTDVQGDAVLDVDTNGNLVWAWSTFDHLEVNRHPMGLPDWTHGNALVYTPNDGNLLLSMRNQSWIIKIDYQNGTGSGDILWHLGYQGDFSIPGDDPADWFYAQHFPSVINIDGPQITLGVWDNGNSRVLNDSGEECGSPNPYCYSRSTVFQIDEGTKTADLAFAYLPGFFSVWGGSNVQLQNNDIEFDLCAPVGLVGSYSQVMEVTQDAAPQVAWQLNIQGGPAYRSYRIPSLYPGVTWSH